MHEELPTDFYQTMFIGACARGSLRLIRELIEVQGSQVDLAADGNLALMLASQNGRLPVVRYLVEQAHRYGQQQVGISAQDSEALCLAAQRGHLRIVKYLVEKAPAFGLARVDITAQDNLPLILAAKRGCLALVRYLVEEAPRFDQQPVDIEAQCCRAIKEAAAHGHLRVVRYLFEDAVKFGQAEQYAWPAAVMAVRNGQLGVLKYLAGTGDLGADIILNFTPWFRCDDSFISHTASFRKMVRYLVHELPYLTGQVLMLGKVDDYTGSLRDYLAEMILTTDLQLKMQHAGVHHTEWRELMELEPKVMGVLNGKL